MKGDRILIDTNIAVYIFRGHAKLARELKGQRPYVSSISRVELLTWREADDAKVLMLETFLDGCELVRVNRQIEDIAIQLIRRYKLRLSDGLIAATAMAEDLVLVSGDSAFLRVKEGLKLAHYRP